MAFLSPVFEHDLFISYARVDDQPLPGEDKGWVTLFHEALEVQLSKRLGRIGLLKIWRDPRIEGGQFFDQTIKTAIERSALFLALTSHGFRASEYCQQELRWFRKKARHEPQGMQIGDRSRVYNILLYNINHRIWKKLFGRISGHPFHDDAEFAEPNDPNGKAFKLQLRDLVDSLHIMLLAFKDKVSPALIDEPSDKAPAIYIADVADSLLTVRKRLVTDLSRKGIHILKQIPPPYDRKGHEQSVNAELDHAQLAIHLFDDQPGEEIEGAAASTYPQKQAQLALAKSTPQLIWFPPDLKLEAIASEAYKAFLNKLENEKCSEKNYDLVRCAASELAVEILHKSEQLQVVSPASPKGRAILLDTHLKDQLFAFELGRYLAENGVQPFMLQETDEPKKTLPHYEELLNEVDTLVIFFGNVAQEWVRERLQTALQFVARQLVAGQKAKLNTCCVYLLPPRTPAEVPSLPVSIFKIPVLDNSRSKDLEPNAIASLLNENLARGGP